MGEARDAVDRFYGGAGAGDLDLPYADSFRVEDGLIVEHEVLWDTMTMMAQLGAAPPH